jgi:hypothetical protein
VPQSCPHNISDNGWKGSLDWVEWLWGVWTLEKRLVLGAKRWLVTLECGFRPGFCFQRWLPFCGSIPARKRDFGWVFGSVPVGRRDLGVWVCGFGAGYFSVVPFHVERGQEGVQLVWVVWVV